MSKKLESIPNSYAANEFIFKTIRSTESKKIMLTHEFSARIDLFEATKNVVLYRLDVKNKLDSKT